MFMNNFLILLIQLNLILTSYSFSLFFMLFIINIIYFIYIISNSVTRHTAQTTELTKNVKAKHIYQITRPRFKTD